ncbi:hypothetical protein AMAG_16187 [Allomyces macrogynus ATCC 38327]|uniref:Ferric oxidoreductase domain-containing protein n=1 Tax=Allomyces macrogynus (strain ATCC 38327) TaxID=578462 RepID=A0A0L0TAR0_ALLM3|nr:hypothetical protein AMAG_16187 [Allomyces macrogynus ATCC 38327]|eukprot:KNE71629.1 hypothetical protein AMAG_16187 [Allomyces macrogynus ATCC 38327]
MTSPTPARRVPSPPLPPAPRWRTAPVGAPAPDKCALPRRPPSTPSTMAMVVKVVAVLISTLACVPRALAHGPPGKGDYAAAAAVIHVGHETMMLITMGVLLAFVLASALARLAVHHIAPTVHHSAPGPAWLIRVVRLAYNHPNRRDLALAVVVYLPLVLVASLSTSYKYDVTYNRFGWIAVAHLLVATLLSGPFSPACLLLARHQVLRYHAFFARAGAVLVTVHMALHLNTWVSYDVVPQFLWGRPVMIFGLAAWLAIATMVVTSLPWLRNRAYTVFVAIHHLMFLVLIAFSVMHRSAMTPYAVIMASAVVANKLALAYQVVRGPARIEILIDDPAVAAAAAAAEALHARSQTSLHAEQYHRRVRSAESLTAAAKVARTPSMARTRRGSSGPHAKGVQARHLRHLRHASTSSVPSSHTSSHDSLTMPNLHSAANTPLSSTTAADSDSSGSPVLVPRADAHVAIATPPARSPPAVVRVRIVPSAYSTALHAIAPHHTLYLGTPPVSTFHPYSPRRIPRHAPAHFDGRGGPAAPLRPTPSFQSLSATWDAVELVVSADSAFAKQHLLPHAVPSDMPAAAGPRRGSIGSGRRRSDSLETAASYATTIAAASAANPAGLAVVVPWTVVAPLPVEKFARVLFVAGGTGITSVLAWLERWAAMPPASSLARHLDTPPLKELDDIELGTGKRVRRVPREIMVVWFVSKEADAAWVDSAAWMARVPELVWKTVVTRDADVTPASEDERAARVAREVPSTAPGTLGFVSGPVGLVRAVQALDRDWWLHAEPFAW